MLSAACRLEVSLASLGVRGARRAAVIITSLSNALLRSNRAFRRHFLARHSVSIVGHVRSGNIAFIIRATHPIDANFSFIRGLPISTITCLGKTLVSFGPTSSGCRVLASPVLPRSNRLGGVKFSSRQTYRIYGGLLGRLPNVRINVIVSSIECAGFSIAGC